MRANSNSEPEPPYLGKTRASEIPRELAACKALGIPSKQMHDIACAYDRDEGHCLHECNHAPGAMLHQAAHKCKRKPKK